MSGARRERRGQRRPDGRDRRTAEHGPCAHRPRLPRRRRRSTAAPVETCPVEPAAPAGPGKSVLRLRLRSTKSRPAAATTEPAPVAAAAAAAPATAERRISSSRPEPRRVATRSAAEGLRRRPGPRPDSDATPGDRSSGAGEPASRRRAALAHRPPDPAAPRPSRLDQSAGRSRRPRRVARTTTTRPAPGRSRWPLRWLRRPRSRAASPRRPRAAVVPVVAPRRRSPRGGGPGGGPSGQRRPPRRTRPPPSSRPRGAAAARARPTRQRRAGPRGHGRRRARRLGPGVRPQAEPHRGRRRPLPAAATARWSRRR